MNFLEIDWFTGSTSVSASVCVLSVFCTTWALYQLATVLTYCAVILDLVLTNNIGIVYSLRVLPLFSISGQDESLSPH